jgi:hypothetical protein
VPWNISRSAQFYDKEVLKFPAGLDAIKSVVLDATMFAQGTDPDQRTVVPAGTILKLSATNSKRYVAYDGSGTVKGILARPVDLLARATAANEPAPMFFHQCVFATEAIVGFTTHAAALASALTTCKFE